LPTALPTLVSVVGTSQLLFGTDYCFTPPQVVVERVQGMAVDEQADWLDIMGRSAVRLLAGTAHPFVEGASGP
jgi:predicted TIM-barrel fold metal-dependent hydrolase